MQDQTVRICLCTNEAYAPHCATTIHSVICNRKDDRSYQFFVLARVSELTAESLERFVRLQKLYEQVTIEVMDVSSETQQFQAKMRAYYTQEINYRFLLFTKLFSEYDKILYLDCDIICTADISELYDVDLKGNAAAAALEYGFYEKQLRQVAMFHKGIPCSYANYIRDIVGAKMGSSYFNSGVMVYDLGLCRHLISMEEVAHLLVEEEYVFPDQDCLNHLLAGNVLILPSAWNYQNLMAYMEKDSRKEIRKLYKNIRCNHPKLLHFTGGRKPWIDNTIPWHEQYERYVLDEALE